MIIADIEFDCEQQIQTNQLSKESLAVRVTTR